MPNIEIHGLPQFRAEKLRGKIFELFEGKHYVVDMVVAICPTIVKDKDGVNQPFIRLVAPCQPEEEKEILEMLQVLGIDIEHLQIKAFLPKTITSGIMLW